jgi:phosphoenolpyruvate carboxykinase (ATP)
VLYEAAKSPRALFENVMVDYLGRMYMSNEVLTGNGRAVVQRDDLGGLASDSIDLPPVDELDGLIIAFITRRNTILPPVAKLTPAQGAAAFMLGESIHTSGSDPLKAGESVRVVGTNPFICGDEAFEGNRFYEFVRNHPDKIHCYQLNTGGVGEIMVEEHGQKVAKQPVRRIEIAEMAALIRGIVREEIEWEDEPVWGTQVPKAVEGVDLRDFDPTRHYDQETITDFTDELREERRAHFAKFESLHPDIVTALKL